MLKIKVEKIGEGLHPSESVVEIKTIDGNQKLVISNRSIDPQGFMNVGYPIRQEVSNFLVELPRETMSGSSRVWVDQGQLEQQVERKFA